MASKVIKFKDLNSYKYLNPSISEILYLPHVRNDKIGQIIYNKIIDKAEKQERNQTIWIEKVSNPDQTLKELFFVSKAIL